MGNASRLRIAELIAWLRGRSTSGRPRRLRKAYCESSQGTTDIRHARLRRPERPAPRVSRRHGRCAIGRSRGGCRQAPVRARRTGFSELKGRWQRPDGGYILEIRAIDTNGKIGAAYLNPHPINVANAQATIDGTALKVFIELRARNYPGSTYTLSSERKVDRLQGVYFQAALQQNFVVAFVRMK